MFQLTGSAQLEIPRPVALARPVHVRDQAGQLLEVLQRGLLDDVLIQDGQARRHLRQRGVAKLRRDDDLFDFGRGRCEGDRGQSRSCKRSV